MEIRGAFDLQWYLADKKAPAPRTLQGASAQGPNVGGLSPGQYGRRRMWALSKCPCRCGALFWCRVTSLKGRGLADKKTTPAPGKGPAGVLRS